MRKVLIVSNRLPINLVEQDGRIVYERSIGGVATALDAVAEYADAKWVGWTGYKKELPLAELKKVGIPGRYIPVQAKPALVEGYYDRFANGFLWPVLHGKMPSSAPTAADKEAYTQMNQRFADAVRRALRPEDTIWIHDFHLMLLPKLLRQQGVVNRIGFFLHVPFPRPSYWQKQPYARALAQAVAKADLIGVQTHRDARRLKRYAASAGIRTGLVRAFPIGVDYTAYHAAAMQAPVRRLKRAIKAGAAGKKIIFSLSRLDYTKGIITQLQAVRRFLARYANRKDVVYKLVVAPSRQHLPEYDRLQRQIKQMVDRINTDLGSKSWRPIDYEHKTIGFDETAAWYGAADLLLLLPDADGMNLIAKEYVAARHDDEGMAVLSTAMGSAEQLGDALLVPPADPAAAASALGKAFRMSSAERPKRWHGLRATVSDQNIFWWADKFLATLNASQQKM